VQKQHEFLSEGEDDDEEWDDDDDEWDEEEDEEEEDSEDDGESVVADTESDDDEDESLSPAVVARLEVIRKRRDERQPESASMAERNLALLRKDK